MQTNRIERGEDYAYDEHPRRRRGTHAYTRVRVVNKRSIGEWGYEGRKTVQVQFISKVDDQPISQPIWIDPSHIVLTWSTAEHKRQENELIQQAIEAGRRSRVADADFVKAELETRGLTYRAADSGDTEVKVSVKALAQLLGVELPSVTAQHRVTELPRERVAVIKGDPEAIVRDADRVRAYLYKNYRLDISGKQPRIIGHDDAGFTLDAIIDRLASGLIVAAEVFDDRESCDKCEDPAIHFTSFGGGQESKLCAFHANVASFGRGR